MLLLGTGSAVLDAAGSLCSVLCSLAGAALGLDGLGALYASYARALMLLDEFLPPALHGRCRALPLSRDNIQLNLPAA